jgi:hypothetical protein
MPRNRPKKGAAIPGNSKTRRRRVKNRARKANNLVKRSAYISGVNPLSPCAENYLRVLTTPFTSVKEGMACIPDSITLPSYKFKVSSRGTFSSNTTNSFGFVSVDPFVGVQNDSTTISGYSNAMVNYTNGGNVGGAYQVPGNTGVTPSPSNSEWSLASITAPSTAAQFRLVGCGLRARYIGIELYRGGRMLCYKTRNNTSIPNGVTTSQLLADNYYHTVPIDRKWHQITYFPSRTSDISYNTFVAPATSSSDTRCMAIFVDNVNSAGNAFEFETVAYYEYIANSINIPTTQSHSDPAGFGAVLTGLPTSLKDTAASLYNTVKAGALQALEHSASGAARGLIQGAMSGGSSLPALGWRASREVTIEDVD